MPGIVAEAENTKMNKTKILSTFMPPSVPSPLLLPLASLCTPHSDPTPWLALLPQGHLYHLERTFTSLTSQ